MSKVDEEVLKRAQGCLLGQLAGDSLGGLVEFKTPEQIRRDYPNGVRDLTEGGTWNTLAGQPTDDSEMALALARMLAESGEYDREKARKAYVEWLGSHPFDCGLTVAEGLEGRLNQYSQANGALMRISPLGIFGTKYPPEQVARWAMEDAELTHPNRICKHANALFAMAISHAVRTGRGGMELYDLTWEWTENLDADEGLLDAVSGAADAPPPDYLNQAGWVLTAFRNAFWQMLNASGPEEAVIDTIMRGGDTDTNAAVCGALLGAVHGREAIPERWTKVLLNCRPDSNRPEVRRPRPEAYWPHDALDLAEKLLAPYGG